MTADSPIGRAVDPSRTVDGCEVPGGPAERAADLPDESPAHADADADADGQTQHYQAALLKSLFEAGIDGILAVDPAGHLLAYNQRFLEQWQIDEALTKLEDDVILRTCARQVADPAAFVELIKSTREAQPARHRSEIAMADGRILDRSGTRLVGPGGEHLGFSWSFRDITEERARLAEIAASGERFATLARTLQRSLLPARLPAPTGIDLAARYHPALEGLDVGGDFYDVFPSGDDWFLVIGDVCGKGAEAAALTALVRHTIRAAANHDGNPASVLDELNAAMIAGQGPDDEGVRFATVCCIRLRPGPSGVIADIACGGHPRPLVLRSDGAVVRAGVHGSLIGVFDEVDITTTTERLGPGDAIVAVTDGVLEARDRRGRLFDDRGLVELVAPLAGRSATELGEVIERTALDIQGGVAQDDIAILVARISES